MTDNWSMDITSVSNKIYFVFFVVNNNWTTVYYIYFNNDDNYLKLWKNPQLWFYSYVHSCTPYTI